MTGGKTEVWLTRQMFGEKLEKIAECDSFDQAMAKIAEWKTANVGSGKYKIEKYDRIICGKGRGAAVDFGDYYYFMLVKPSGVAFDSSENES